MVNAFSRHNYAAGFARRLMMNKSLRVRIEESSDKTVYGFQAVGPLQYDAAAAPAANIEKPRAQKKSRRFRRLLKLITGRRQTEWTGATRCPNEDNDSHKGESLIDRKRANFLRDR
jgi:hypothetical protein